MTHLRKLSVTCYFVEIKDGLLLYKLADGQKQKERIISKRGEINFQKAIEICRAEEITKLRKKSINENFTNINTLQHKTMTFFEDKINADSKRKQGRYNYSDGTPWIKCNYCSFHHPNGKSPANGKRYNGCNRYNHFQRHCPKNINAVKTGKEASIDVVRRGAESYLENLDFFPQEREPAETFLIGCIGKTWRGDAEST